MSNETDFPFSKDRHRTVTIPKWKYKLLRPYNGFTGIERIRSWQLTKWAIQVGMMRTPAICSISGAVAGQFGDIQYHNENYYDPLSPWTIHKVLHQTLHRRFVDPTKWEFLVDRYRNYADDDWFVYLPMKEPDMAAELRAEGVNGETMIRTFINSIPGGCPKPFGKLHTLDDFESNGELKANKLKPSDRKPLPLFE